jgi:hypothetical protein
MRKMKTKLNSTFIMATLYRSSEVGRVKGEVDDDIEGCEQRSFLCCGKRGGSAVHGPTGTKRTASDSGFDEGDSPNNPPQEGALSFT